VLGARPLRRTIQRDIEDLAERILFGDLHPGEIVVVDVAPEGSELPFTFTGQPQAALPDHAPVELSGPDEQASA
jgi:ATP-dependent Clp protease ATP-binding subunit ClpC